MSEMNELEAFEAWMHTFDFPPILEGEVFDDERYMDADCFGQFVYDDHYTQRCWAAWQARAALSASPAPSGEVEAVKVVAFLMKPDTYDPYVGLSRDWSCDHCEPLMTAAQHQRHMAAMEVRISQSDYSYDRDREEWKRQMADKDAEISRLNLKVSNYHRDFWEVENERQDICLILKHHQNSGIPVKSAVAELVKDRDELRAQLAAQQAAAPVGWALAADRLPVSGKSVLAFYLNSHGKGRRIRAEYIARWTVQAEGFDPDPDTECVEYSEQDDAYYILEGWYELIDNWDDYSRIAVNEGVVTHWMDMPTDPTAPQQGTPDEDDECSAQGEKP